MAVYGAILASLTNEELGFPTVFHFRHPVWRIQPPTRNKTYRERTIRTQRGFVLQRLPENPSNVVLQVVYIPEHKPAGLGGIRTFWSADGPRATWGRFQGLDSLRQLEGSEVTFRWAQKEARMFFRSLAITYPNFIIGNSQTEEEGIPQVVNCTLTFIQSSEEDWP